MGKLFWDFVVRQWLFLLVLVVLFVAPFFRGLFFRADQEGFMVVILLLLIATALWHGSAAASLPRGKSQRFRLPLALGIVAALAALYWLSIMWAVAPRLAIDEALVMTGNLVVLVLAFWFSRGDQHAQVVFMVTVVIIALVQLVGAIPGAFGLESFSSLFDGKRLASFLQYPNATAGFFLLAYFAGLELYQGFIGRWRDLAFGAISLIAFGLLATYSRGGLLTLGGAVVLLLLVATRQDRGFYLVAIIESVAAGGAGLAVYELLGRMQSLGTAFVLALATTMVISAAIVQASQRVNARTGRIMGLAGLAVAVVGAIAVLLGPGSFIMRRLSAISLSDYNLWSRLQWTLDALRIARDHPFGTGGGGWSALYLSYQRWGYITQELHDAHAQTLVEVGIPGLILWIGLWVVVLWTWFAWRRRTFAVASSGGPDLGDLDLRDSGERGGLAKPGQFAETGESRFTYTALTIGVVAVMVHSTLDFALSLAAISFLLFATVGILLGAAAIPVPEPEKKRKRRDTGLNPWTGVRVAVVIIAVGLLVFDGVLMAAASAGRAGIADLINKRPKTATPELERAVSLDRWNPVFYRQLSQAYLTVATDEGSAKGLPLALKARAQQEKAIALNPYDPDVHVEYARILLSLGRYSDGLDEAKRALDLQKHEIQRYEQVIGFDFSTGVQLLQNNKRDEGLRALERIGPIMQQRGEVAASEPQALRKGNRLSDPTDVMNLRWAEAQALMGDLKAAQALLPDVFKAKETNLRAEAYAWHSVVSELLGDDVTAQDSIEKALKLDPNIAKLADGVRAALQGTQ